MLKCENEFVALNGFGTLLCIDELKLTAPVQSYELTCGSDIEDTAMLTMADDGAIDESIVISMRFQILVAIAVDVISRARCGENRVDSVGSILMGNGNGLACG